MDTLVQSILSISSVYIDGIDEKKRCDGESGFFYLVTFTQKLTFVLQKYLNSLWKRPLLVAS